MAKRSLSLALLLPVGLLVSTADSSAARCANASLWAKRACGAAEGTLGLALLYAGLKRGVVDRWTTKVDREQEVEENGQKTKKTVEANAGLKGTVTGFVRDLKFWQKVPAHNVESSWNALGLWAASAYLLNGAYEKIKGSTCDKAACGCTRADELEVA